jgi:Tfp pilus assembly protein PilX
VVSLIILLILTLLGVSALSTSTNSELAASNMQQAKLAFYAAQSGVDAFRTVGNAGNDLTNNNHILALTRNLMNPADPDSINPANALEGCSDRNGLLQLDCAASYLEGLLKARVRSWYRGCQGPATACPGFSLGVGMVMPGCHRYQVEGTGWLDADGTAVPEGQDETQSVVEQWFTEVALCAGS